MHNKREPLNVRLALRHYSSPVLPVFPRSASNKIAQSCGLMLSYAHLFDHSHYPGKSGKCAIHVTSLPSQGFPKYPIIDQPTKVDEQLGEQYWSVIHGLGSYGQFSDGRQYAVNLCLTTIRCLVGAHEQFRVDLATLFLFVQSNFSTSYCILLMNKCQERKYSIGGRRLVSQGRKYTSAVVICSIPFSRRRRRKDYLTIPWHIIMSSVQRN